MFSSLKTKYESEFLQILQTCKQQGTESSIDFRYGPYVFLSALWAWLALFHSRGYTQCFFWVFLPWSLISHNIAIWRTEFCDTVSCLVVWLRVSSESDLWACKWDCLLNEEMCCLRPRAKEWRQRGGVSQSLSADTGTELAKMGEMAFTGPHTDWWDQEESRPSQTSVKETDTQRWSERDKHLPITRRTGRVESGGGRAGLFGVWVQYVQICLSKE